MKTTFTWLNDLLTHFLGFIFEEVVDGLLPALFQWYFVTPYAIDYPIVFSGWHYVRLTTAGFLLLGFFVSGYRALRGDYYSNELVKVFAITLVFASMSLFILDYGSFGINLLTDSFRSPILVEAYKNEKNGLEIVQEGLSEDEIDFSAFSPVSVLKYSFGMSIDDEKKKDNKGLTTQEKKKGTSGNGISGNAKPISTDRDISNKKDSASNSYPGMGSYKMMDPQIDEKDLEENLYEVFLSKNGGAGFIACVLGMVEIIIMCVFAIFKFIIQMLIAVLISLFVAKGSFTGSLLDLKNILVLYLKTTGITLVFNFGWVASSVLTHTEELAIIHPQFWAIAVYFVVILFTYFFWVKEIINNIISPAVQQVRSGTKGAKNLYSKVRGRFTGATAEVGTTAKVEKAKIEVQTTSTLTNQNNYLEGLSPHERYHRDPEFFRNKDYDNRHKETRGNFYAKGYDTNFNKDLGCYVKDAV